MDAPVASRPSSDGLRASPGTFLRRDVIIELRERSVGLLAASRPLVERLAGLLSGEQPSGRSAAELAAAIQAGILDPLAARYDAIDEAVRESGLPFAEINGAGRVVYANAALLAVFPQASGAIFASLFGTREDDLRFALRSGRNESLRISVPQEGGLAPFRIEIGPLDDEEGQRGNYVLLLDQQAERRRQSAAADGIIRTDRDGCISFANDKAVRLFGMQTERLLGAALSALIQDEHRSGPDIVQHWLASAEGVLDFVTLAGTERAPSVPVRVSVMPNFENADTRAGLLINISSMGEDAVRAKLRGLFLAQASSPEETIREVIRTVHAVVPFDMATFGIYADDMKRFRVLVVEPEPPWPWNTRWFEVTPETAAWVRSGGRISNDLPGFLKKLQAGQESDPVVQAILKDGMQRMLLLPIRSMGGGVRSVLTLLARRTPYTQQHAAALDSLGLEEPLGAAERDIERVQTEKMRLFSAQIDAASQSGNVAHVLADGIVEAFGWEYAAVFRADRAQNRFVMIAQRDATQGGLLTVRDDYSQAFGDGMLGHSFKHAKTVVVPMIEADDRTYADDAGLTFPYIKTAGDRQRSAMVVPLFVRGRPELLLDLESTLTNAFAGPERREAEAFANECARTFENCWVEAVGAVLMNAIGQMAVIVDAAGEIRHVNAAASQIFCIGSMLVACGSDDRDRAVLSEGRTGVAADVTIAVAQDKDGKRKLVETSATQVSLGDDYNHRLWLFTKLRDEKWDWRYLDTTIGEVARWTRAPLMIADGLLRGAADMLSEREDAADCTRLLTQAADQLVKADLTFERLSESASASRPPIEQRKRFDALAVLRDEIARLPHDGAAPVRPVPDGTFMLSGWPDRLGFAFRSVLGLLDAVRGAEQIVLTAARDEHSGWLSLRLEADSDADYAELTASPAGDNQIARGEDCARKLAALAPEAVRAAVEMHGGYFYGPPSGDTKTAFVFQLPPGGTPR